MALPEPDPVTFLIGVALSAVFGAIGLALCIIDHGISPACIFAFIGLLILLVTIVIIYLQDVGVVPSFRRR